MARTQKSTLRLVLVIAATLLVCAGVATFFFFRKSNHLANLPAFPTESYMQGARLWSHEDFRLEGKVDGVIQRSESGNRLVVSIRPEGSDHRLPVIIDAASGKVPVQREQRLALQVSLGSEMEIRCKHIEQP